jgi:hypothetical protein
MSIAPAPTTLALFDVPPLADFAARAPSPPIPPGQAAADESAPFADQLLHPAKPRKRGAAPPDLCPFVVAIDHRERAAAYPFTGMQTDSRRGYRPVAVERVVKHLPTGDYSIVGLEDLVTVERKQLSDFFATLAGRDENGGARIDRFKREHERMAAMINTRDPITGTPGRACVVIEASWESVRKMRASYTRMSLDSIWGTYTTWQAMFGVPWHMLDGRRLAERFTWDFLRKFWEGRERKMEVEGEADGAGELTDIEQLCEQLL